MFTKKTRILSALLTVCMLISVLACFVVPSSAEEYIPYVEGELYSPTGLVDVSGLDDIATDWDANVTAYKVTNRAGFEKINELVLGGNNLSGYTFTMANDIDFEWKNFPGIGINGKAFAGVFDGNGFVVEQLLISAPYSDYVGLFGNVTTGFAVKNLGIASGLVVGGEKSAALVGYSNAAIAVYNCWNAATVLNARDSGALTGALQNNTASTIYNSYNLGLAYFEDYGGPLYGTANNNYFVSVKNSYNFGQMVADTRKTNQLCWSAFGRTRNASKCFGAMANNAYVTQEIATLKSTHEASKAGTMTLKDAANDDQAVEYAKADFTGEDIITRLNTDMDTNANPSGYTVQYDVVEGLGYPVLTYYKDGEAVIRRVAHTADNIGENTLAEKVDFFAAYCAQPESFPADDLAFGDLTIDSADDLMALSFLLFARRATDLGGSNRYTGLGITKISFTADIDMKDCSLFKGADGNCGLDSFLPLGVGEGTDTNSTTNTALNVPVEGNGHVIKNWCSVNYSGSSSDLIGALFVKMDASASIKDLGMENANVVYSVRDAAGTDQHSRYGVMVGKISKTGGATDHVVLSNCWVTGKMTVTDVTGSTAYAEAGWGAVAAWDIYASSLIENCWANVDVEHADYPQYTKASAVYNVNAAQCTNVTYIAEADDVVIGGTAAAQSQISTADLPAFTYELNQSGIQKADGTAVYYGLNEDKTNPVWTDEANQTRKVTLVATKANNAEYVAYGKAGEEVDLLALLGAEEANFVVESETGSLANGIFTIGAGDGRITTDLLMVSDNDYQTLKGLYDQKPAYWDEKGIGTALADINTKLTDGLYGDQDSLDTDIQAVAALFAADAADKVPASAAFEAVTLECGVTVPSFATPGDAVYKNIGIYDIQDLLYIRDIQADSYTGTKYAADQTIYLCNDLDLTEATDFVGIWNLPANFDGQNKTISNFNTTTGGFFRYAKNEWIKNIRFDSCEAKITNRGALVLGELFPDDNAHLLENITVENCTLISSASGNQGIAAVLGQNRRDGNDHTLRNITVRGTSITKSDNGIMAASGLVVSLIRFGGDVTMENILVENNFNNCGKADGAGFVFGSIDQETVAVGIDENNVVIDGLIVRNNNGVYVVDEETTRTVQCVLGGMWQRSVAAEEGIENHLTVKNAQIYNNNAGSVSLVGNQHVSNTAVANGNLVFENVYSDVTNAKYGAGAVTYNILETADFATGKSVYESNANGEEFLLDNEGTIYLAETAPEGTAAPVKVSFVAGEEEKLAYYTAPDGTLLAADAAEIEAVYDCKLLDASGEETTADAVVAATYAENTSFTLVAHEKAYAGDGKGNHTATCANCDYEEVLACDAELDAELEGETVIAPTEDAEGYTRHKCSVCASEWVGDVLPKVIVVKSELDPNTLANGTVTLPIALKNNPDLKGVEITVDFDTERLAFSEVLVNDSNALVESNVVDGTLKVVITSAEVLAAFEETVTDEALPVLFKLVFNVVENAPAGDAEVNVAIAATNDETEYEYVTEALAVTVIDTDLDAAEAVDAMIADLGTVTLESEAAILAARAAYENLTDAQKAKVLKLADLEAAEAALAAAKDEAAAAAVDAKIEAIGDVTLDSEDAIAAAREAYDALTDDQKALVENEAALIAAEETLAALKKAALDAALADLTAAIEAAEAADEGITVTDDAAEDVETGTKFVTTAEKAALDAALADAKAALEATDAATVEAATAALNQAVATFTAAVKTGSYVGLIYADKKDDNDFLYQGDVRIDAYRLVDLEGDLYFTYDYRKVAKNTVLYLGEQYVKGSGLKAAYYGFDTEGILYELNGPVGEYFYEDGVIQKAYQLVEFDGAYYFITDGNKLAISKNIYLSETYVAGTDLAVGYYQFDETGKLVQKNGPVDGYFYENGVRLNGYQLVEYEGSYYFINGGNKLAVEKLLYLGETYVAGTDLSVGYYWFNENGVMEVLNGPFEDYFYLNSVRQKAYQLVEFNGDYYFINDYHRLAKDKRIYLSAKYVEGTDLTVGYYTFDADGKLVK